MENYPHQSHDKSLPPKSKQLCSLTGTGTSKNGKAPLFSSSSSSPASTSALTGDNGIKASGSGGGGGSILTSAGGRVSQGQSSTSKVLAIGATSPAEPLSESEDSASEIEVTLMRDKVARVVDGFLFSPPPPPPPGPSPAPSTSATAAVFQPNLASGLADYSSSSEDEEEGQDSGDREALRAEVNRIIVRLSSPPPRPLPPPFFPHPPPPPPFLPPRSPPPPSFPFFRPPFPFPPPPPSPLLLPRLPPPLFVPFPQPLPFLLSPFSFTTAIRTIVVPTSTGFYFQHVYC